MLENHLDWQKRLAGLVTKYSSYTRPDPVRRRHKRRRQFRRPCHPPRRLSSHHLGLTSTRCLQLSVPELFLALPTDRNEARTEAVPKYKTIGSLSPGAFKKHTQPPPKTINYLVDPLLHLPRFGLNCISVDVVSIINFVNIVGRSWCAHRCHRCRCTRASPPWPPPSTPSASCRRGRPARPSGTSWWCFGGPAASRQPASANFV